MGLFSGSSKKYEPKPTPQEEALADKAASNFQRYVEHYLPAEREYKDYAKSAESPYVLRQNQFKAETPYLEQFNAQGVSPGALEPRLMLHQSELGLKRNLARQFAIPQHFDNYTKQLLEIVSLGQNLEIDSNRGALTSARLANQAEQSRAQAGAIRQQGIYNAAGTVAGFWAGSR